MGPLDENSMMDPADINLLEGSIIKADLKTGRRIVAELAEKYGYEAMIFQA